MESAAPSIPAKPRRIAHLADIHIQDRRRAEYAAVFERLYESLRAEAPAIIVVAGDVFDNKMRASPHNLEDVAAFLSALAAIAPVVLIAGNHDTNCLTPGALDLLTPLVTEHRALQPPRLTYWRNSGVYEAHGIVWTVIAADGPRPTADAERAVIEAGGHSAAPHLCLFHEEVNGALLPNGTVLAGHRLDAAGLAEYDIAMGGHIHLRAKFAPRAAYCGSLIQQNIGESHRGHGYILWELEESKGHLPHRTAPPRMRGIDIANPHGFVRIEIDAAGRDVTPKPLPVTPIYWEAAHDEDAPPVLVASLIEEYESALGMPARAVRPRPRAGAEAQAAPMQAPTSETAERLALVEAQAASRTLASHEEIIRELLAGDDQVEAVIALHHKWWKPPASQAALGGKFRILRFEFDNMYAFGPANAIDFTALEGCVSGVIAPNYTGKTSLIEALLFALYEEHPRAPLKKDVIHHGAGSCRLTLEFELDGKPGRITKGMFEGGKQNTQSQYRFEYAGENRTRGGTTETLAEIESVLGSPLNAIASSFQKQGASGESGGFIGAPPAGRKKLIAAILSLGDFSSLERATAKDLTFCGGEVKTLALQYRGSSEAELEYKLDVERGGLEDLASDMTRIARDADRLRGEAVAAAHDLGAAEGAAKEAQDTAARRQKAADAVRGTPDAQECAGTLLAWTALVGQLAPPEERAAPEHRGLEGRAALGADTLAAAAAEARRAKEDAMRAGARVQEARLALAAAPRPPRRLSELREQARAAALACGQAANAPALAAQQFAPAPLPPPGARPAQGTEGRGPEQQRSGPRPTEEERAAAAAELERLGVVTPADRAQASRWDPADDARLSSAIGALGAEQEAPGPRPRVETRAAELAEATHKYDEARASLQALGGQAADAAKTWPVSPPGEDAALEHTAAELCSAREWAAAVVHIATVRGKFQPQAGCPGCDQVRAILDENAADAAQAGLAAAEQAHVRARARAAEAKIEQAAVARAAAEAALATARTRAGQAGCRAAREQYVRCAAAEKATALLETANYWRARDAEAWEHYDANRATWEASFEAERSRRATAAAAERTLAQQALEAAGAQYKVAEAGWAAHESAAAAAVAAEQASAAATAAAAAANERYARLSRARSEAVGALLWWRAATAAAAEGARLREAAAAAASAARASAARAEAARQRSAAAEAAYDLASAALSAARQQAAASEREAARLTAELEHERRRAEQHAEASARQAALKAYRAVLRPTGGIADRLLERGRALLERRINEALRELGARFEIEIEPNHDVRQRAHGGKTWLPLSLVSGYQAFVLSLSARLALWRLTAGPRPDAIVIDEGFGACDEDNLEAMVSALEALATAPGGPRLVFLVSHVDALKARIERVLEINTGPTGSRLVNAAPRAGAGARAGARLAPPPLGGTPANARAAPQGSGTARQPAQSVLGPDPANGSNVYCEACQQSLRAAWASKHLASAKHALALKKAAGAGH